MDNLKEKDKFLEAYKFPRLNYDELEQLNRLIASNDIKAVIKKLPMPMTKFYHRGKIVVLREV